MHGYTEVTEAIICARRVGELVLYNVDACTIVCSYLDFFSVELGSVVSTRLALW